MTKSLLLFFNMFNTLRYYVVYMIIVEGVEYRFSFPAVFDQLGVFEETKLMGDGGLVHLQEFADLGHASFLFKETIEDADPGGIREILEQLRYIVESVFIYFIDHRSFTPNARMAFMTAMTMTPTSAKIAIHICARPKALRISVMTLTAMAKTMFS